LDERNDDALSRYEEALARQRKQLAPDHPDLLVTMNDLANLYQEIGRAKEAILLHETVFDAHRKKLGADHKDTLGSALNLANAYNNAGRHEEARVLNERTLAAFRATLGSEHVDTLLSMNNVAVEHLNAGRTGDAIPLFEEVFNGRRRKLGPDHPDTFTAMTSLLSAYVQAGRKNDPQFKVLWDEIGLFYDRAASRIEKLLDKQQAELGPDHPETRRTKSELADAYEYGTDYTTTSRMKQSVLVRLELGHYLRALETAKQCDPEVMGAVVETALQHDVNLIRDPAERGVVGELRLLAGQPERAVEAITAGLKDMDQPPGWMYKILGMALYAQGKQDEARQTFRKALVHLQQPDGSFDLKKSNNEYDRVSAYFLDLVTEDEFAAATKDSKQLACYPWFHIGQRKEFDGDREGAIAAYKRSVELLNDGWADKSRSFAKWRLAELSKM
jgi:tetratricopeptide (TPR) repeat protein